MKRILITGKDSYIGTSVEKWLMKEPDKYQVDTLDMRDGSWKEKDFHGYDVVFHVAGIAHVKETDQNRELYYRVNRDLAYETARKAKKEGIKQFIFLSSMSVYGIETGIIEKSTIPKPKSAYGKSKLQAEKLIHKLQNDSFKIVIIRPPMVYGKGCKGNYQRLAKLALRTPIFPDVDNKRSMIYIDNLSEYTKKVVDNQSSGLFFPQNSMYVKTSEMVRLIAKSHGKEVKMTKIFNPLLRVLNLSTVNKVFGDLVYDMNIANDQIEYYFFDFTDSIKLSEC